VTAIEFASNEFLDEDNALKRRTFLRNTAIEIATIAGTGLASLKAEKPGRIER
jgi:hypothetical protein